MTWALRLAVLSLLPAALFAAQDGGEAKYEEVFAEAPRHDQRGRQDAGGCHRQHSTRPPGRTAQAGRGVPGDAQEVRGPGEPTGQEIRERISKKYQPEFEKARKGLVGQVARGAAPAGGPGRSSGNPWRF